CHRHTRLLRTRSERPRLGAAENGDELPPLHRHRSLKLRRCSGGYQFSTLTAWTTKGCCIAKERARPGRFWVIFDRSSRFSLPIDVRFAPKATLDVNGDGLKKR